MRSSLFIVGLAGLISSLAVADEASVKQKFEATLHTTAQSITKTPYMGGLYEVYAHGQTFYTDENVTAVLSGNLLDTKTMKNVTAERVKKLSAIKFSDLPLELAVKTVRGDGSRVMATFEDPNCGYCKRIAQDLSKLDNVTIYTFLYPILSPDSKDKAKRIWCAADRAKAWSDLMIGGKVPGGTPTCDAPIQRVLDLGQSLAVSGTPTLFFANGVRVPGAIAGDTIEKHLAQTAHSHAKSPDQGG